MISEDQWTTAGREPRLAEILSDQVTRDLMRADGLSAEDVTAVIDRMRASVRPLDLVPPNKIDSGDTTSRFVRSRPLRAESHSANLHAAAGVVSRWIASLGKDKRASAD